MEPNSFEYEAWSDYAHNNSESNSQLRYLGYRMGVTRLELLTAKAYSEDLAQELARLRSSRHHRVAFALAKKYWAFRRAIRKLSRTFKQAEATSMAESEAAEITMQPAERLSARSDFSADGVAKTVALFLPQFRPHDVNDAAWGRGFTEWSNVLQGIPLFSGHWQPRFPMGGIHSLDDVGEHRRQSRLASEYGIDAFAYYLYLFDDESIFDDLLHRHSEDADIAIDFMAVWANENWSRKWDGGENQVILRQSYGPDYALKLVAKLLRLFASEKYLKTEDGRPIFAVYRPGMLPDQQAFLAEVSRLVKEALGVAPYFVGFVTFGEVPHASWDARAEFPPHAPIEDENPESLVHSRSFQELVVDVPLRRPGFVGNVFDYSSFARIFASQRHDSAHVTFRSVMLAWDNTARNPRSGSVFNGFSLRVFEDWLCKAIVDSARQQKDVSLTFINAWNEWAEGTYLMPDTENGSAQLAAVLRARQFAKAIIGDWVRAKENIQDLKRGPKTLIHIHAYYPDVWEHILNCIEEERLHLVGDVVVTSPSVEILASARMSPSIKYALAVENRGRDILPFLDVLRLIGSSNYEYVFKIHTKKRGLLIGGEDWSDRLLKYFLSRSNLEKVVQVLETNPSIGIVGPASEYVTGWADMSLFLPTEQLVQEIAAHIDMRLPPRPSWAFFVGSMFGARRSTLEGLLEVPREWFEVAGWIDDDGKVEHAIERLFSLVPQANGHVAGIAPLNFGA